MIENLINKETIFVFGVDLMGGKRVTEDELHVLFREVHGDRYEYPKGNYRRKKDKIPIVCAKHGTFYQIPQSHLLGMGCQQCAIEEVVGTTRMGWEAFVAKARAIHGERYRYPEQEYRNSNTNVHVECPAHGAFEVTPNNHLNNKSGCPTCGDIAASRKRIVRNEARRDFPAEFSQVHEGRYAYGKFRYHGMHRKSTMTCSTHGDFEQTPLSHLAGAGCPACGVEKRMISRRLTTPVFVEKAMAVHGDRYRYDTTNYTGHYDRIEITCERHGPVIVHAGHHLAGSGCPRCANVESKPETELFEFVREIAPDALQRSRSLISPLELDIVVPSRKLAIEFTGLYWHSDDRKHRHHLQQKHQLVAQQGYALITIFEDEWAERKDVVTSVIRNHLGVSTTGVGARKTTVREIPAKVADQLLDQHHLQGKSGAKINIGAYHGDDLIAVMAFSRPTRQSPHAWELRRFVTDGRSHPGVASKLLKYFVHLYDPSSIVSFSDSRWFGGQMYQRLGFTHDGEIPPDYHYCKGKRRWHKSAFKKKSIEKKLGHINIGETEREAMKRYGFSIVWDCGKTRWVWRKT